MDTGYGVKGGLTFGHLTQAWAGEGPTSLPSWWNGLISSRERPTAQIRVVDEVVDQLLASSAHVKRSTVEQTAVVQQRLVAPAFRDGIHRLCRGVGQATG